MTRILFAFISTILFAPYSLATFKNPPESMAKLLDAPKFPRQLTSPTGESIALLKPRSNPSIQELAVEEVRVGGLRINPNNFSRSRIRRTYKEIEIISPTDGGSISKIEIPSGHIAYPKWSPDGKHLTFLGITPKETKLHIASFPQFESKELKTKPINAVAGDGFKLF